MQKIKAVVQQADWILIAFLLLVTNQSIITVKFVGLLAIYILRPNFKFGLRQGRIPWFYLLIVAQAVLNLLFHIHDFSKNYLIAFTTGVSLWIMMFLIFHQVRLSVEKKGAEGVYATLRVMTVLNVIICLFQLLKVILKTGYLNPYVGLPFPYGQSTGDNIFGFFLENSLFNMMLSIMLAVYFLFKKDLLFALMSTLVVALIFGNVGNLIFIGTLLGIFFAGLIIIIFKKKLSPAISDKIPSGKFYLSIPLMLAFFFALYFTISPQNFKYSVSKIKEQIPEKKTEANTEKKTPDKDSLSDKAHFFQVRDRTTTAYVHNLKGKKLSFMETYLYMQSSFAARFWGAGPVRFSSLTASRMAGFDKSRLFSKVLPRFQSPEFHENHFLITQKRTEDPDPKYYTSANWPDSFYNQIFGEYGISGFLIFLIFYIGYFLRFFRKLSYSFWIALMIGGFAVLSYLFESISVIVFWELLVLAEIVPAAQKKSQNDLA